MSKSFINVYQSSPSLITHLFIEDGKAYSEKVAFKPFLGVHAVSSEKTTWTDMYGKPAKIKVFESIPEMKEWKKENNIGLEILGDVQPSIQFIATQYRKDIEIQRSGLIIHNLDIEVLCKSGNGFPHADTAAYPVNAITVHEIVSDTYQVFSTQDYDPKKSNVKYTKCLDEKQLLDNFLSFYSNNYPHILTGWNAGLFDIPYLVNRINKILGPEKVKKLSRDGVIRKRQKTNSMMQVETYYFLQGHIIWDYLDLYRKYCPEPRERYSLGFIAQTELGTDKVDYSEYENLADLYEQNFELFLDYNIQDTTLVGDLDKKLGYIDLALSIMYKAKCSPDAIFGTVQPWDCLIYNEMLRKKILCPETQDGQKAEFPGGYVKDPKPGIYEWVTVYDIVSSYPNQIRSFNISPEMILSDREVPEELKRVIQELAFVKHPEDTSLDICPCENIEKIEKYTDLFQKYNVCFTANGRFFKKDKEGIIPSIYSKLFNERLSYKKIAKEKKKEYSKTKDPKVKHELDQAELYSYTEKILLNSGYGALANKHSRYFDLRMAEAITTNGQTCCRGISNYIEKEYPFISTIYQDTDSVRNDSLVEIDGIKDTIENMFQQLPGVKELENGKEYLFTENMMSPCYVNGKIQNKLIKAIYRHRVKKAQWKLVTISGKEIFVTNDHSIMIMRDNKIIEVKPSNILATDKVITIQK